MNEKCLRISHSRPNPHDGTKLGADNLWAAQIPGRELQVRHHCYIRYIHQTLPTHLQFTDLRSWPWWQASARAEVQWLWSSLSAGQFRWKVTDTHTRNQLTVFTSGLSWKVWVTTLWMWWTAWWPEEDTKWKEILSRGLCLTFITRMISKTDFVLSMKLNFTFCYPCCHFKHYQLHTFSLLSSCYVYWWYLSPFN